MPKNYSEKPSKMKSNWIKKLPQHTPPDNSWELISDKLSFEEFLNEKKQELPLHQPEEVNWNNIAKRLPKTSQKQFSVRIQWMVAAASILLFITILWQIDTSNQKTVSYTEETPSEKNIGTEQTDINEVNRRCNEIKILCKRPEIKELREEIENLDKENASIEEQMELFGTDADLMEAQQRIQLKKAELAKEIIELMNNHATHS